MHVMNQFNVVFEELYGQLVDIFFRSCLIFNNFDLVFNVDLIQQNLLL